MAGAVLLAATLGLAAGVSGYSSSDDTLPDVAAAAGTKRGLVGAFCNHTKLFEPHARNWQYDYTPSLTMRDASWRLDPECREIVAEKTLEFVPIASLSQLASASSKLELVNSRHLLGMNEPSDKKNESAALAASRWKQYEALAATASPPLLLGTPAPGGLNLGRGQRWLNDFFGNCTGCRVDFVAVHWYECDGSTDLTAEKSAESMMKFLAEVWASFSKPIWLTEFNCGDGDPADNPYANQTKENHLRFMKAALPKLEAAEHVARYSWFRIQMWQRNTPAHPGHNPGCSLTTTDGGALSELGEYYNSYSYQLKRTTRGGGDGDAVTSMPVISLGHPDTPSSCCRAQPSNGTCCTERANLQKWWSAGGIGIDAAYVYGTQAAVGGALAEFKPERAYVTTKIPCAGTVTAAAALIAHDLAQLRLRTVDLLVIHNNRDDSHFCNSEANVTATWMALQAAHAAGQARSIGVSFFDVARLAWVVKMGGITPSVNQYHVAVGLGDTARHSVMQVKAYCSSATPPIQLQAFSTLSGGCMELPVVRSIAAAHGSNISAAMVCLRWVVQQGMLVAVSSDEAEFDREDLVAATTDTLVLTDAEMAHLSALGSPIVPAASVGAAALPLRLVLDPSSAQRFRNGAAFFTAGPHGFNNNHTLTPPLLSALQKLGETQLLGWDGVDGALHTEHLTDTVTTPRLLGGWATKRSCQGQVPIPGCVPTPDHPRCCTNNGTHHPCCPPVSWSDIAYRTADGTLGYRWPLLWSRLDPLINNIIHPVIVLDNVDYVFVKRTS